MKISDLRVLAAYQPQDAILYQGDCPIIEVKTTASVPDWDTMSVGHCEKCSAPTALIDGLCYDCRPRFVDQYGPR